MDEADFMRRYLRSPEAFAHSAHSPAMFAAHAWMLHDAATALRERFRNSYPEHVRANQHFANTQCGPELLLLGYAFECAVQAVLNLTGPSKPDRPDLYSGAKSHDLLDLAQRAAVVRLTDGPALLKDITREVFGHLISHETRNRLTDVEKEVLGALTGFAVYAGRYPTPLSTKPREGPPWSERPIWDASWDSVADALWERFWNRARLAAAKVQPSADTCRKVLAEQLEATTRKDAERAGP
ncbi:MAG: hypothetical protein IPH13_08870 [Planctomycetes bacterium]|nr:hypothetical protein [Planctomycetota bacterium]